MNEIAIRQFVELTEQYIKQNREHFDQKDLEQVSELYEDLATELARQQLFDELYH